MHIYSSKNTKLCIQAQAHHRKAFCYKDNLFPDILEDKCQLITNLFTILEY